MNPLPTVRPDAEGGATDLCSVCQTAVDAMVEWLEDEYERQALQTSRPPISYRLSKKAGAQ